jgi:hypothetical protein
VSTGASIVHGHCLSSARAIAAARGLPCLAQESPGSALGIIAVKSSLPASFLYQRKHRVDRWCRDLDEAAHFLDGGHECIDLQGPASFEILQH